MWITIEKIASDNALNNIQLVEFAGRGDILGVFPIVKDEILISAVAEFVAEAIIRGVAPISRS